MALMESSPLEYLPDFTFKKLFNQWFTLVHIWPKISAKPQPSANLSSTFTGTGMPWMNQR